ncbi:hypothetical protein SAMN05192541_13411 [Bradyrhizobium arachidis]|nr:hypothetical protein SAMN05192541_13411 [Bradyrhizobium arachidis]
MSFQRVEITSRHVADALMVARGEGLVRDDGKATKLNDGEVADDKGIDIWADTTLPYLQLRRRGGSVKWMVRTKKTLRSVGGVRERGPDYLSVAAARRAATDIYTELRYAKAVDPASDDETPVGWTLGQVCVGYQRFLAHDRWINNRTKPPSEGTNDDVRRAFGQASYQDLGIVPVLQLDRVQLNAARDGVSSYRQRQKCTAYIKAALSWAADEHPDESGLTESVPRWWENVNAGKPDPETMRQIEQRRKQHRQNKADLTVDAIAATLFAHEKYCAARERVPGFAAVTAGIRWGIWWVAFTGNRRLSTVELLRDNLKEQDEFGEPGWGRAEWTAEQMKGKEDFWLPLPPVVYAIAAASMSDWQKAVDYNGRAHTACAKTNWVFASQQRYVRGSVGTELKDVRIYPNSLNRHLQRMRAAGALKGLPLFNPHLVRSPVGDFIEQNVTGVASSLVLSHKLKDGGDEAAATTRNYYLTGQRMREKTAGMKAWSEALVAAYLKIPDARLPEPIEQRRGRA